MLWNVSACLSDLENTDSASLSWQIRIRDPNQGGRDITDEIMSGVMWPSMHSTVAQVQMN